MKIEYFNGQSDWRWPQFPARFWNKRRQAYSYKSLASAKLILKALAAGH